MRKAGLATLVAGIILGCGNLVLAREGGGGHHDGVSGDKRGGAAVDHRSQKASENSNAQWSTGATKGLDRANLRNQDGQGHHGNKHGGKARGHGKDHSGKARGHGKSQPGQGNDRDSN